MKRDTQAESEALVRLMLAARYQDAHLSLSEEDTFEAAVERLAWISGTTRGIFIMQETAKVRAALESESARDAFLTEQCTTFTTPEARADALQTLTSLIESDGVDPRESRFLARVKELLGA